MRPVPGGTDSAVVDEYRLVRRLGAGAMGEVFLAEDTLLDRLVALKFIAARAPLSARARFLTEARAAAKLQHPNVVTVHRVSPDPERPYIVTEYIDGRPLNELDKPVPWQRILSIAIDLARGLAASHRMGILHRDIKPANAIETDGGDVKLVDFGLAKLLDGEPFRPGESAVPDDADDAAPLAETAESGQVDASPAETAPGVTLGTPYYMAPEVWLGQGASTLSDQYSLGVLLFELATGKPPHYGAGGQRALRKAVCSTDAPPLSSLVDDIHPRLAAIVARCLARTPADRHASVDALRDELESLADQQRALPIPEGNPYRGLMAFESQHRSLFFGRDRDVRAVVDRLRARSLVVVAGDSGVGKSSLIRAGVIPLLEEGALGDARQWKTATVVPGARPLRAILAALADRLPGELEDPDELQDVSLVARELAKQQGRRDGTVLFVDQLEELVTAAAPEVAERAARCLAGLCSGVLGVRVVATARADFLTRLAALPSLGPEIAPALYLLGPMSRDDVRNAIVGPARAKRVEFESDELVDELVEAGCTGGGLPLLQFALAELWDARKPDEPKIADASLRRIGGVGGALSRHADEAIAALPAAKRATARELLVGMVGGDGTRIRRQFSTGEAREVCDALVDRRLLVARELDGDTTFEIAHETLVDHWPALRQWLDDSRDQRLARERLTAAAEEWSRLDRSRDALWSARQLGEVAAVEAGALPTDEVAFLAASRRRVRWLRWRWPALAALIVAALVAVSLVVRHRTRQQARARLDADIQTRVERADELLAEVQQHRAVADERRADALAKFSAMQRHEGEKVWQGYLAEVRRIMPLYAEATAQLEAATRLDPHRDDVAERYAEAAFERLLFLERAGKQTLADELASRLVAYDETGTWRERLDAPGPVAIDVAPDGATVTLYRYEPTDTGTLAATPLGDPVAGDLSRALAPGSYVAEATHPGRAPARLPFVVERGQRLELSMPLPPADAVPDGYVYVPPGPFLFGNPSEEQRALYEAPPMHERETGAFLIAVHETTFADWLEYLRSLDPAERDRRRPLAAEPDLGGYVELVPDGDGFELRLQPASHAMRAREGEPIHYAGRDRRAEQDWLRLPVMAISWRDAKAYAAWLDTTGRVPGARLCREDEWERAARGADGRPYPHGNVLAKDDANIDVTYDRDDRAFGPDEVGSHPASVSPFGLHDMAGNVFELVDSVLDEGGVVGRGGGYYYAAPTNNAANRQALEPSFRAALIGLRVCADVATSGK